MNGEFPPEVHGAISLALHECGRIGYWRWKSCSQYRKQARIARARSKIQKQIARAMKYQESRGM